jgi:catechol 2,3-dioxygenase
VTFETPGRGDFVMIDDQFAAIDKQGNYHSGREALDLDSVFGELSGGETIAAPLPDGIRVGHVHLHVADLDAAMRFYSEILGFQEQFQMPKIQMGDVTLPDYVPHIIAFNTWAGVGAQPAPDGASGLQYFTVTLPDPVSLEGAVARLKAAGVAMTETPAGLLVRDPSRNLLQLTTRQD